MRPDALFPAKTRPFRRLPDGLILAAALLLPASAWAHGGEGLLEADAWSAWSLTPEISGPILVLLAIYIRGAVRRRAVSQPVSTARHALFAGGMLALFLSLQSPIDPMGERLFLAHQIQHLLLRMLGPMLVVLAHPQGLLIAGLPEALRGRLVAPVLANGAILGLYRRLTGPVAAFLLFLLSLYVWQIPPVHDETAGGFILWVPASMMAIIAVIIVIHDWNLTEKKRLRRGYDIAGPAAAAGGPDQADRGHPAEVNKRLGLLLGLGALTLFGLIIGTGVFVVSLD